MTMFKNPTLRRRTKALVECAEDALESRLLGYELKSVGELIIALTTHIQDLQSKVDRQAEHIKAISQKEPCANRGGWVRVTERLPENSGNYLVTLIDGFGDIEIWVTPFDSFGWGSTYVGDEVIAWMPLPEPYKEGNDEID